MMDQWNEIKMHFMGEDKKQTDNCFMNITNYYGSDNYYGLWLDMRTTEDNRMHGTGTKIQNTKDGIQVAMTKTSGKGPYKMHIFIVSDAQLNIQNLQIASVMH